ncbi:enoyl-CoA hydratase/isomerase family protein [Nocardioides zeicaulis]|uniref:Enoyl-CoA hydratase/isomerase family protein n=1 Tax=Nocardioides zeicaulis TaxID=1776857 RepID=A0ABV6DWM9_9ACTN
MTGHDSTSNTGETRSTAPVLLDIRDGVATITLNRPEASNALDLATAHALHDAVREADANGSVAAVLVLGEGRRFCAGGDVASMVRGDDRATHLDELATAADAALVALAAIDKPVVAGVQGAVAGAGLAVMLSCDLVVAEADTKFLAAYAGVGLTPDCGLSWLLPRAVGQQRALELLLTPRTLAADEALAWGLVTEVITADETDSPTVTAAGRARALARALADGPAHAHGQARRLVRNAWAVDRTTAGRDEATTIARAVTQPAAAQLLQRFAR